MKYNLSCTKTTSERVSCMIGMNDYCFTTSFILVYYFFTEDDPFPNDRNCAFCRKCCIGCCYRIWLKFQDCLLFLVHDMLFDTTVTLCIILNTAFLAVEHHGMSEDLKHVLDIGNKVIKRNLDTFTNEVSKIVH